MVFACIILAAGRATHSLGPLEDIKSIHVYIQIMKIIFNYKKYLILA